jgi:hypothetical protein
MLDQMQPPPRALPLSPQLRDGQPDRRHQIAKRQLREHPRIDLVGLARQRRQPLDLLRVANQHLPPVLDELVVHEPRPVHRLDHPPHRLVIDSDPARQPVQAVAVRRRREMVDQLAIARDQADIDPSATETQPTCNTISPISQQGHDNVSRNQPGARRTVTSVGSSFRTAGRAAATARA